MSDSEESHSVNNSCSSNPRSPDLSIISTLSPKSNPPPQRNPFQTATPSSMRPMPMFTANTRKPSAKNKKTDDDRKLVAMLMKEQNKLQKDFEKSRQDTPTDDEVPQEPCKIEANGYIDYKVNFGANLSDDESNSWCDEASESENQGEDGYYDEEDDRK